MSRIDPRELVRGDTLRCRRPMVSFYPPGHPERTTTRGPLISRGTTLRYVGPYPNRPGVYVAETAPSVGQAWEVPFKLTDLATDE